MFAVAVLLALLKLGGFSGTNPLFLKMMPMSPVAKAAEPAAGEAPEDEALNLPDANGPASGPLGRLLTITSVVSRSPGGDDIARCEKSFSDEATVFYRPSSGKDRGTDGEPVCGNLGDFPKSSKVVFPLPEEYFNSYEDTWGAVRPQGGHEGADLMSPTGTPEFAITDGTIVPVKGANENGWNRLGGYTVMLEAAYDAGPIKKGDLFYYAHMDRERAPVLGTKVRAGQQIGLVGDTGDGREATRGKFPPHLHFGWYDTGSANSRTDLESGAMNPYPLLLWLESNGGAVTGGARVYYCEAPREPTPDSSGTTPDLDTGDRTDARPSPVLEARDRRNSPESEHQGQTEEKSEGTNEKSKEAGATGDETKVNPAGSSEKNDEPEDEHGESSTPGPNLAAPDGDPTSSPSSGASVEDVNSQAEIRAKIRAFLKDPSPPDPASRRSYVSVLADMLRKAEKKNERDGQYAGKLDEKKQVDNKKQKDRKKTPETPGRSQNRKGEPVTKTGSATARSQPVLDEKDVGKSSTSKKDPEKSSETTKPKDRKSPAKETSRETRDG